MFKKSGNPKVEELCKSWTKRSYNLGGLNAIKRDLLRYCAWCGEGKLNHGNAKYCTELCSHSAMAWAYPQKENSLFVLLVKQEWKCEICKYDYRPLAENIHKGLYKQWGGSEHKLGEKFDWGLIKRLKSNIPKDKRLEIDHVIAISKGGQAIGVENLRALCFLCHKEKTRLDNSGPRKKS